MRRRHVFTSLMTAFALLAALVLAGCTAEDGFHRNGENGSPGVSDPEFVRTPPPVQQAEFVGTNAASKDDGARSGVIDMTNVNKGYIGVQCNAAVPARVRIIKGAENAGEIDDYTIDNDGTTQFYPLARGDGEYTFILYIFLQDTPAGPSYERFLTATTGVSLESEFAPFLVQSQIVNYNESSSCVKKSHEITQHCKTDLEVVQQIYDWIAKNIRYDTAKAEAVVSGGTEYVPNPDDTLRSQTGICYDYASLAAAMLRANGIPTKLVKGDVLAPGSGSVYHAWNLVWVDEVGWIAVELPTKPGEWTRIDTTFAAGGGGNGKFIGDGENYTDMSYH